jgi:tetratricopeptide (TPR) repeat protein
VASGLRQGILAYYDKLMASGVTVLPISHVGRAIAIQLEGFEQARAGRDEALAFADKLEGPLFPNPEETSIGGHIWLRRAWEIRRVFHLYRGDAAGARSCQEQLDRLSTRHAYAPYGGGSAFMEAQAFAYCGDLMGLKQSIEAITLIVEKQYPAWMPFLQVATGDYHRLRGEPERALQAYEWALAGCSAGKHAAWAPAVSARIEALLALSRDALALSEAEQCLARCREVQLGVLAELELERVLSLAEARAGRGAEAVARIERALARAGEHKVQGVRVGMLHEARARVALGMNDAEAFADAAGRAAELYRAGRNPALVAKYERLIESARTAEIPLSNELTHAAEISAALGISHLGQSFHTVFEECESAAARKSRALRLLIERSGASAGFLYAAGERAALTLQAAEPHTDPPPELGAALSAYLKAELDETSDVTMTCFDEAANTSSLGAASGYQPVLLWAKDEGQRTIVGVAALRCEREAFSMPGWDLLSAVSKVLVEPDEEVVSIIG